MHKQKAIIDNRQTDESMLTQFIEYDLIVGYWIVLLIKKLRDFCLIGATLFADFCFQEKVSFSGSSKKQFLDGIDVVHMLRHWIENDTKDGNYDVHNSTKICQ